jgi:hypothetical protein
MYNVADSGTGSRIGVYAAGYSLCPDISQQHSGKRLQSGGALVESG